MSQETVLDKIKQLLKLPSGLDICTKATSEILGTQESNKEWIKSNFSSLVEKIQLKAYDLYLEAEKPVAVKALKKALETHLKEQPAKDDCFNLILENFWAFDKFFLSLSQGRRARAGKAFEHVIKVLFNALGYPYTPQPIINGQPDFLLPSVDHFRENPMDCIIFTVKRTLRERWRQITTEGTLGHIFFLATIDEKIATRDIPEMRRNRIYLVTPENIKTSKYSEHQNIISFETFFHHYLDPAMTRWKENGIID